MKEVKITIITVVYNGAATIERTMQSVIRQSYDNVEYIVVDGGSTDGTVDIIEKYSDRIAMWISEHDEGIYDAMNKGINMATGDVIAFLNADDWYEEDALAAVASEFENEKLQILFANLFRVDVSTQQKCKTVTSDRIENRLLCMPVYHPATFAKKELFVKYGLFDLQYMFAADYEWIIRVLDNEPIYKCVDKVTTYFSVSGISNVQYEKTTEEARRCAISHAKSEEQVIRINKAYDERIELFRYRQNLSQNKIALQSDQRKRYDNVIVFGSGVLGEECCRLFCNNDVVVRMVVDNDERKWGENLCGIKISSPDELVPMRDKPIVVAALDYADEIFQQLYEMGYAEEELTRYTTLRKEIIEKLQRR